MNCAIDVPAEVGVLKGVLMSDVDAMIGDEDRKAMHQVWVRAEEGGK